MADKSKAITRYLNRKGLNSKLKGYLYLQDAIAFCIDCISDPNPKVLSYLSEKYQVNKSMISVTMKKVLIQAGMETIKPLTFVREATLVLAQRQN